MRATEITPSMISTQHHSEARNRAAITALPTRLAPRNRPTGDRSTPCIRTPRFTSRSIARHIAPFNPALASRASRPKGDRLIERSQRDPQPAIDGERPRGTEARWVGQVGRRVGQFSDVEQSAPGVIPLVEEVLDEAIDLHLLAHLVG